MMKHIVLLSTALTFFGTVLRADFSGDYDAGTPGNYNLVTGLTTEFGTWDALLTTSGSGGSGTVTTNSAPGSITLSAMGNAEGGNGTLVFGYDSFASATTVSFDFSGSVLVQVDGVTMFANGSSYEFGVLANQELTFTLTATGSMGFSIPPMFDPMTGMQMGGGYTMPGFSTSQTVTLSNFIAPIPEPATYAILLGGVTVLIAGFRRRRQR